MLLMRIFSAAEEKETKREKKEEGILKVHFSLKKANWWRESVVDDDDDFDAIK